MKTSTNIYNEFLVPNCECVPHASLTEETNSHFGILFLVGSFRCSRKILKLWDNSHSNRVESYYLALSGGGGGIHIFIEIYYTGFMFYLAFYYVLNVSYEY